MSSFASASYTNEIFRLDAYQQFGELEDPSEEQRLVDEFEVLASVMLKKIDINFGKEIRKMAKTSKLKLLPFDADLQQLNEYNESSFNKTFRLSTTHTKFNHLNIGDLSITLSLSKAPEREHEEAFIKRMEKVLKEPFGVTKTEIRFLGNDTYVLKEGHLILDIGLNSELPVFEFYEDSQFNTYLNGEDELDGDDFIEEDLIVTNGSWEINSQNELILYYPTYASPDPFSEDLHSRNFRIDARQSELVITEIR